MKGNIATEPTNAQLDYIDMWRHFSDDAAKMKDRLWTVASWLFALMSGLLAFVAKQLLENDAGNTSVHFLEPFMLFAGIILSVYAVIMIWEYGMHVKKGWNRVDFIATKIDGMSEIIKHDVLLTQKEADKKQKFEEEFKRKNAIEQQIILAKESKSFPRFAWRLLAMAIAYGFAFSFLLVRSLAT